MRLTKSQRLVNYYCGLADFLETIRWEYFTHMHEISEFVPYAPFDIEEFSLTIEADKETMGVFYPDGDPFIHHDPIRKGITTNRSRNVS